MAEVNALPKSGKVISLFSGVGGSSLGYKMAGWQVLASVEFLDYQARTYRKNHIGTRVYEQDIRKMDPNKVMAELGLRPGELDILDGSPPCSSFSTAGKREKLWGKKKSYGNRTQRTDDLFFEYTRFLRIMQPKAFVAENVKGLVMGKAKGYFKKIFRELESCGYVVKARVLNAKYYGVSQGRERLIFIGYRKDLGMVPKHPAPSRYVIPLGKVMHGLPLPGEPLKPLRGKGLTVYELTKVGDKFDTAYLKAFGKRNMYTHYRLSPFKPAPTLTTSPTYYHWDRPRVLTVSEMKRITTFPDDFILLGTLANQYEACGRTVPPLMMKAIAEGIRKDIGETIKRNDN
ncbi:DNA cytosine methyltransferase [Telluribacter humicola]